MTFGTKPPNFHIIMATPFTFRKELVNYGKLLYDKGMLAGSDGNISVRLDDDRIMVTPSGVAKGRMTPDDMVIVDINGKHLQGNKKASSELLLHLYVYQHRDDIKAVVHSHALYATSFDVAGPSVCGAHNCQPGGMVFPGC